MKIQKIAGYVIVVVLLVMLTGLLVVSQGKQPSTETPTTPTVVLPTTVPTATPPVAVSTPQTRTMEQGIAPCTFASQTQAPPDTVPLDAFTFSDPQVVLTNTTAIKLFQWLPDGRRILLTRALRNHLRIETLNVETGELQVYAETSQSISGGPVWLPTEQGVIFVESISNDQDILHIDQDMNQPISDLETDFAKLFFSASADIRHLIFSEIDLGDSIKILRTAYDTQSSSLVKAYLSLRIDSGGEYQASLFSDASKVALYNSKGFYLADTTGHICKLEHLASGRKWGLTVKWSADGRYLAIITASELQPHVLDLEIFDTITGEQRAVDIGEGIASGIDWHPSRNILLVTAQNTPQDLTQNYLDGLYLVDVNENIARRILKDHQYVAIGYWGALWSPSGHTIAIACHRNVSPNPAIREGRICLIKVEAQQ